MPNKINKTIPTSKVRMLVEHMMLEDILKHLE